jgi:hypothetical protein
MARRDGEPWITTRVLKLHNPIPQLAGVSVYIAFFPRRLFIACIPGINLGVQSVVQGAVELVGICALEHHGKIFAIRPIGLVAEL